MKLSLRISLVWALVTASGFDMVDALSLSPRSTPITEKTAMEYVLSVKYVTSAFYNAALQRFTIVDFQKAGMSATTRGRYQQIADHEAKYAIALAEIIGGPAWQACIYNFPLSNATAFVKLSEIMETTSASAALGALRYISNQDNVAHVAAMMAGSARHAAWASTIANQDSPWSNAFETPISIGEGWSYFASYLKSCPSSNPNLGLAVFPALAASLFDKPAPPPSSSSSPAPLPSTKPPVAPATPSTVPPNRTEIIIPPPSDSTNTYLLTFLNPTSTSLASPNDALPKSAGNAPLYLAVLSGLVQQYVPVHADNTVSLPPGLVGIVYVVVTSNPTSVGDDNIIAGPAVLQFPLPASLRQT